MYSHGQCLLEVDVLVRLIFEVLQRIMLVYTDDVSTVSMYGNTQCLKFLSEKKGPYRVR